MEIFFLISAIIVMIFFCNYIFRRRNESRINERRDFYREKIEKCKNNIVSKSGTASLPVLNSADHEYRPVASENLLAIQDGAIRMEVRSTGRYKTGGTSVSIPIMKGVRYRVSTGSIRAEKTRQATAYGRLLATDRAIVFEGNDKNERITWTQVANVELHLDGFTIVKRSGPPRTYHVSSPNHEFAAVVELMLVRTA